MIRFLFLGLALAFVGCTSSLEKTIAHVNTLPVEEHPAYFKRSLDAGKITQDEYDEMMTTWRKERAAEAEEAKLLASMTPVERAHYKLEKERLEILKQQLALQQEQLEQSQQASQAQSVHNIMSNATSSLQSNAQTLSNMANSHYGSAGR